MTRRIIKVGALTLARLLRLLLDGSRDCRELAEDSGLHYVTVLRYCREMHLARAAHIAEWRQDDLGRHVVKVYKVGNKPDAKRPPALSGVQKAERYRERRRAKQLQLVVAGAGRLEQAANGRVRFASNERKDAA
jgi:hypothetical protein